MSEHDAFGRTRDESGHNDLGWGTSDVTRSAAEPESRTVASKPPPSVRRRRSFAPFAMVVPLLFFALVGGGIYLAVDAGREAVNTARDAIGQFRPPGGGGGGGGGGRDDTVPKQVKPRDLFGSPGDLRRALRIMEREVPGRITNFSIHDNGINAQVLRGGKRAVVIFAPDAEAPEVISRSEGSTAIETFSYEEVNPTAASRLMKAANSRLGQSPADVNYFVVSRSAGAMQWGIYYKGGRPIALGDSRGRYTRRIA